MLSDACSFASYLIREKPGGEATPRGQPSRRLCAHEGQALRLPDPTCPGAPHTSAPHALGRQACGVPRRLSPGASHRPAPARLTRGRHAAGSSRFCPTRRALPGAEPWLTPLRPQGGLALWLLGVNVGAGGPEAGSGPGPERSLGISPALPLPPACAVPPWGPVAAPSPCSLASRASAETPFPPPAAPQRAFPFRG